MSSEGEYITHAGAKRLRVILHSSFKVVMHIKDVIIHASEG